MKVGILHQDLEDHEIFIKEVLQENELDVSLYDVRETSLELLRKNDVILNRVFASVANRNYKDNLLTLEKLSELESDGVKCLNSHYTTQCDYSKYFSAQMMKKSGIPTPETYLIKNLSEIPEASAFANEYGFNLGKPIVVKRDIGGRGKDLHLVRSVEDFEELIKRSLTEAKDDDYHGGYIVQQFVESVLPHDYRISMINGDIIYYMARTFIDDGAGEKWVSSMSLGSRELKIDLPREIADLALRATESIGAFFNDVDIMVGEEGAYIIENNPTPNFAKRQEASQKQEIVIGKLVDEIKSSGLKNEQI